MSNNEGSDNLTANIFYCIIAGKKGK